jgi:hypothetical protein
MLGFETKFWPEPAWNITRQTPDLPENFAFLQNGVLFMGINLVGGIVQDQAEWDTRNEGNLQWLNESVASFEGSFKIAVIVSHADPDIESNESFFTSFFTMVQGYNERIVFVHRNLIIDSWKLEANFNDIPNMDVVVVEGSLWPPMWIQIDVETGSLLIDQVSWFQEYLTSSTMPASPSP